MSDDENTIIDDQPLKVLGLFHKRQVKTIQFDQDKYLKLYDTLSCTICKQLFNNPVYLKCSHRFCKQCIEKHIRFAQKKSCPNCRGDLSTKRDLRIDYVLSTIIEYSFGDRHRFCQEMDLIENVEALTFSTKLQSIVRSKSITEDQQKSIRKKIKTNQEIQMFQVQQQEVKIKRKRGRPSQSSRIQQLNRSRSKIQYQSKQDSLIIQNSQKHLPNQQIQTQQADKKISQAQKIVAKKKRGRKRNVPIIEVQSQQSDSPQQIKAYQYLQNHSPSSKIQQLQKSIKSQKYDSFDRNVKQKEFLDKYMINNKKQKQSLDKQVKILKAQLGQDYMLKLMKIPILQFIIPIKLQKSPFSFISPTLKYKSIQISNKSPLLSIYKLLQKLLNVPQKNIKLSTNYLNNIIEIDEQKYLNKSIGFFNQEIWKTTQDVQLFHMKDLLNTLQDQHKKSQHQIKCRLFQGMQTQLPHLEQRNSAKKRGRKAKRNQQNNSVNQDLKRIFYYQIVTS